MATATIKAINKISDTQIQVDVFFDDGSTRSYSFESGADKTIIRQAIKADVEILNTLEGRVNRLRTDLLNQVIS